MLCLRLAFRLYIAEFTCLTCSIVPNSDFSRGYLESGLYGGTFYLKATFLKYIFYFGKAVKMTRRFILMKFGIRYEESSTWPHLVSESCMYPESQSTQPS